MRDPVLFLVASLAVSTLGPDAPAQQRREVRGVVVDEADRPLPGVAVCPFATGSPFTTAELLAQPATRTGADGTFVLTWDLGQEPQLDAVLFVADRRVHVAAGLAFVDMTPVVLPPARTLAGTVRDRDGRPLAGVRVEARDWLQECGMFGIAAGSLTTAPEPRTAVRTDASGRFVLEGTVDSAIALHVGGDGFSQQSYGPLAAGQSLDAVVERLAAAAEPAATEPAPAATQPAAAAEAAPAPGTIAVRGRVVDPDGDRPVVAAFVRAVPPAAVQRPEEVDRHVLDGRARGHADAVRTGDDGTFVLHLPPGRYCLVAAESNQPPDWRWPGRERNPTPLPIEVEVERAPASVELRLQPLVAIRGTVAPARLPRGCMVRLIPSRPNWSSIGDDYAFDQRFVIQADGSFAATGLQARKHEVQLLLPRGFRQGLPDKVPLGVVDVADGGDLRLDAAKGLGAVVHGAVHSVVPASRLAVVSLAANDNGQVNFSCVHYWGPVAPVGRDGTYRLQEPPGQRALLVVDLWTGVPLHRGELRPVRPGTTAELDLEVSALPLDVVVEPFPAVAPWLHLVVSEANWPAGLGQMVELGGDRTYIGLQVQLPRPPEPARLWLPAGPTRLVLRPQQGVRGDASDILADVTVDPAQDGKDSVTLRPRR